MTPPSKPHSVYMYIVLVAHCLFGGLFAHVFAYGFYVLFSETLSSFVAGVAGAIGSFALTFYTVQKTHRKKGK
jgi:hypothetical protein